MIDEEKKDIKILSPLYTVKVAVYAGNFGSIETVILMSRDEEEIMKAFNEHIKIMFKYGTFSKICIEENNSAIEIERDIQKIKGYKNES